MKARKADRALEAVVLGAGILAELFPLQALRADELGLAKLFSLQAAHSDELEATGEMVSFGALRAPQKLGLGHESDGVETVPEEHSVAVKKLVMIRGIADSALRRSGLMTVGVTLVEKAQADRTDLLMLNESSSLGVSHSKEFPAFGKSMTARASWASGLGFGGLSFRTSLFVGFVEQDMMPD